jgi:hypothetical protein
MLAGYFSYLLAEIFGLSGKLDRRFQIRTHFPNTLITQGIISLFSCGLIMGHYAYLNISEES